MPRTTLRALDRYPFATAVELGADDMNHAGHLGFDRVLCVVQRAWSVLFAGMGVRDTDLGDGRTGVIVSDVAINYRAEGFAGERLQVELAPFELEASTFRFAARLTRDGTLVALLDLGIVAFDYQRRAKGRWPADVARGLGALQARGRGSEAAGEA